MPSVVKVSRDKPEGSACNEVTKEVSFLGLVEPPKELIISISTIVLVAFPRMLEDHSSFEEERIDRLIIVNKFETVLGLHQHIKLAIFININRYNQIRIAS